MLAQVAPAESEQHHRDQIDDDSATDGFSQSLQGVGGRAQLKPTNTIDKTTGTHAMIW